MLLTPGSERVNRISVNKFECILCFSYQNGEKTAEIEPSTAGKILKWQ